MFNIALISVTSDSGRSDSRMGEWGDTSVTSGKSAELMEQSNKTDRELHPMLRSTGGNRKLQDFEARFLYQSGPPTCQ